MNEHLSPFRKFMLLWSRVKAEAGGAPERLRVFYDQKQELRDATNEFMQYVVWGDFKRRILHANKKWHADVPDEFLEAWDEYEMQWSAAIHDVWFPLDLSSIASDLELEETRQPPRLAGPQPPDVDEPDLRWEQEFDPTNHDGGLSFQMAFWAAEVYADEVGSDFEDRIHRASRVGLGAVDYLENTIGFNAADVFRRWREVPVTFLPPHVARKHGWADKGSIYSLLDDATRAYVFGAPAAAIAMCRAVLEMVLKEHYDTGFRSSGSKREGMGVGLGDMIVMADRRYDFVDGKRLKKLTHRANEILHSFQSRSEISTADEAIIIEFFKTLKFLIQRAPSA